MGGEFIVFSFITQFGVHPLGGAYVILKNEDVAAARQLLTLPTRDFARGARDRTKMPSAAQCRLCIHYHRDTLRVTVKATSSGNADGGEVKTGN